MKSKQTVQNREQWACSDRFGVQNQTEFYDIFLLLDLNNYIDKHYIAAIIAIQGII